MRARLLSVGVVLVLCVALALPVSAVDRSKFRKCQDTPFCRRNRHADDAQVVQMPAYALSDESVNGAQLTGLLAEGIALEVSILETGAVRVRVDEVDPLYSRFSPADEVLVSSALRLHSHVTWKGLEASFGDSTLVVTRAPFQVALYAGEDQVNPVVVFNSQNLLTVEQYRRANDGESFSSSWGGHTDSTPRGPASVAADVWFPGASALYGVPEHAAQFQLKDTCLSDQCRLGKSQANQVDEAFGEPYRLYNLDVFEFELDEVMALYGAVPLLVSQRPSATGAVLWLNSAETYIDVSTRADQSRTAHWISENGVLDAYLMAGARPATVFGQFGALVGTQQLPPLFAIGYHQCRWNYKSEDDVSTVDAQMDAHDLPYDVIWLDIEHTDGKKYFTWDRTNFPHPRQMQDEIDAKGRKMVTIVDPHIKRDEGYHVYRSAKDKGLFVTKADGSVFDGWCWPGSSSYLDFLRADVREYWAQQFSYSQYPYSTPALFTWNDMNEPSVFNGPEVTMPKDCKHLNGQVEHRDVHNLYGYYVQMSTYLGQQQRDKPKHPAQTVRPFVLSRSFFAGSQRFGAVWTGDNEAKWDHLESTVPMLLGLSVGGIQFSGADIGGFFGTVDTALLIRWYQSSVFHPFMRSHAHIEAARREPYLFGDVNTGRVRDVLRLRYRYMPYLYTQFMVAHLTGLPIMRPVWVEFPEDQNLYGEEQQYMVGDAILTKPITSQSQHQMDLYLPGGDDTFWYYLGMSRRYAGGASVRLPAHIDIGVPHMVRGGSVLASKERARRSTNAQRGDPMFLNLYLDAEGKAEGIVYVDDGDTEAYLYGGWVAVHISASLTDMGTLRVVGKRLVSTSDFSKALGVPVVPHKMSHSARKSVDGAVSHSVDGTEYVGSSVVAPSDTGAVDPLLNYSTVTQGSVIEGVRVYGLGEEPGFEHPRTLQLLQSLTKGQVIGVVQKTHMGVRFGEEFEITL